jgi:hypothetical protein
MPVVIRSCFAECDFGTLSGVRAEQDEEYGQWVEFQGHVDCPSKFLKLISVSKSVPTYDQKTSLDGPSCKRMATLVATEEEEKMKEMHLLPVCPACKNALMALLVVDSVTSSCDTDRRIVKDLVELLLSRKPN